MTVQRSPRGCDFCRHDIPAAVVYPAESFIAVVVRADGTPAEDADGNPIPLQGLNGSWMACTDCSILIDADEWERLQDRYYAVTGHSRDQTEGMLLSLWWGFRRNRRGGPMPVSVLDDCTHPVTTWVKTNANPEVVPGLTCLLCGDVLRRLQ